MCLAHPQFIRDITYKMHGYVQAASLRQTLLYIFAVNYFLYVLGLIVCYPRINSLLSRRKLDARSLYITVHIIRYIRCKLLNDAN